MNDADKSPTLSMTPSLQLAIRLLSAGGAELEKLVDDELARIGPAIRRATFSELPPLPEETDDGRAPMPVTDVLPGGLQLPAGPAPEVVVGADLKVAYYAPSAPMILCVDGTNRDASWFARAMVQRGQTLARIAQTLVDADPSTFLGTSPLTKQMLRRLAERVSLHESTIKRVGAYARILCPAGMLAFADIISGVKRAD